MIRLKKESVHSKFGLICFTKQSLIVLLSLGCLFTSCAQLDDCHQRISYDSNDLNKGIDLEKVYKPYSSNEIENIYKLWADINLNSEETEIVDELEFRGGRQLLVIKHVADDKAHYGALIFPKDYKADKKYPVLVWAHGLDQNNPSMHLFGWTGLTSFFSRLSDYVIVVPSFRGQSLVVETKRYCSDGFFGDAFDGATTDALRLLEVVKVQVPNIDKTRICFAGGSRGGTVALLAGERDTSINTIVSISGPVDFFSQEVHDRYRFQYLYQFLSQTKSLDKIRERMIKSSPIFFSDKIHASMLIIHGQHDHIVPVQTVQKFIDKTEGSKELEVAIVDEGHGFNEMERVYQWLMLNNL